MPEIKDRVVEVISFDVPFPADYGGVIDVFYKLKAFKDAGVRVNLHSFEYGRKPAVELENICNKVYYYKRNISKANLIRRKPYIVVSRSSEYLLENLCRTDHPILFEGLHSCNFLDHDALKSRRKIVRTHNIEHDYYACLAQAEKDIFKRYYFSNESQKLKRFQSILTCADGIAAISGHDATYFSSKFRNVKVISAFHPHNKVDIVHGSGKFALYHGSLAVAENNLAALHLVNNIFNKTEIPLIIAGNKPSQELIQAVAQSANVTLRTDISTDQIYELVRQAHINVLPTFQATGIKLKLLSALYVGRHCVVNSPMIKDTGLEKLCVVADKDQEMVKTLNKLMNQNFTSSDIAKRADILEHGIYSNKNNIDRLVKMFFE